MYKGTCIAHRSTNRKRGGVYRTGKGGSRSMCLRELGKREKVCASGQRGWLGMGGKGVAGDEWAKVLREPNPER